MRVALAFFALVLLWSTTPLAIKWSGEGPGYLFGAMGRMLIGLACMLPALLVMRQKLPLSTKALSTYLAVALQIYGAMLSTYWAAQFIPSGWISVIFGLTPMMTALMAAVWLAEKSLSPVKILAYLIGFSGLMVMFGSALEIGRESALGIAAVMFSAFLQSASSVWIKRVNSKLPAVCQVTGGLLIAVPLYIATWFCMNGQWPETLPATSLVSIIYLGAIATTVGFALYYYVLIHLPATQVALITLLTPILSLLLGNAVNHEPLSSKVLIGTALIMSALLLHQSKLSGRKRQKAALKKRA
ncbi:DMT family transporter [Methylicorpusculum sp.]|uniref:DMT family transporter n=1 Tax=Methylicorpusculum sp. TaxID=2713644 RepID=UPI002731D295|nr:DMT family transporter [Methylicorpusculum sp.]MDP2179925.1 DMT family transporter [Methylicorpusculum sp.]MDP3528366.1 DMT family transporter [Methylicorpusculum sp.]MDZ4154156.1 DMT family transporter [Methylicorpusculum sp.]